MASGKCRSCGVTLEYQIRPNGCPKCGERSPFPCPSCGRNSCCLFPNESGQYVCGNCAEKARKASGGGCYVATACYGSYDHPDVMVLRRFRDDVLWPTAYGRWFIKIYYKVSPHMAKRLVHIRWLSSFIRKWFLEPLVMKLR